MFLSDGREVLAVDVFRTLALFIALILRCAKPVRPCRFRTLRHDKADIVNLCAETVADPHL
jgi:hypothetical protein